MFILGLGLDFGGWERLPNFLEALNYSYQAIGLAANNWTFTIRIFLDLSLILAVLNTSMDLLPTPRGYPSPPSPQREDRSHSIKRKPTESWVAPRAMPG